MAVTLVLEIRNGSSSPWVEDETLTNAQASLGGKSQGQAREGTELGMRGGALEPHLLFLLPVCASDREGQEHGG